MLNGDDGCPIRPHKAAPISADADAGTANGGGDIIVRELSGAHEVCKARGAGDGLWLDGLRMRPRQHPNKSSNSPLTPEPLTLNAPRLQQFVGLFFLRPRGWNQSQQMGSIRAIEI